MPIVGLGVDLVAVQRVEHLISRNEEIFRARILGESERSEISTTASRDNRVLAYARSIAGKEAFLKALGTGLGAGMRWPDVEVVKHAGPESRLAISGEAARVMADLKADAIQLSFPALPLQKRSPRRSFPAGQVMAVVMLTRDEKQEISL